MRVFFFFFTISTNFEKTRSIHGRGGQPLQTIPRNSIYDIIVWNRKEEGEKKKGQGLGEGKKEK